MIVLVCPSNELTTLVYEQRWYQLSRIGMYVLFIFRGRPLSLSLSGLKTK